jgi:hypothetical protein
MDTALSLNRLRAGRPIRAGEVTLVPVERTCIETATTRQGGWISAAKEVVAVLIRDGRGTRVLGVDGTAIAHTELAGRVDGLEPWLGANGADGPG